MVSVHPLFPSPPQFLYQSFGDCTECSSSLYVSTDTTGITVNFMSQSFFFSSLARSRYLSLFLLSFSFTLSSDGTVNFTIRHVPFIYLFFDYLVVRPRLDNPLVSQNVIILIILYTLQTPVLIWIAILTVFRPLYSPAFSLLSYLVTFREFRTWPFNFNLVIHIPWVSRINPFFTATGIGTSDWTHYLHMVVC